MVEDLEMDLEMDLTSYILDTWIKINNLVAFIFLLVI